MRIGFDVDGVLADWNKTFIELVKRLTGRDLFGPGYEPTTWHYPQSVGYTAEEESKVWEHIKDSGGFWLGLEPYDGAQEVLERIRVLSVDHDIYFVTSRPGYKAKHQTETWLALNSGDFLWNPTVLISSGKGWVARALHLDAYIDDRLENAFDVSLVDGCQTFLMDRPWNRNAGPMKGVITVNSVNAMLDVVLK